MYKGDNLKGLHSLKNNLVALPYGSLKPVSFRCKARHTRYITEK